MQMKKKRIKKMKSEIMKNTSKKVDEFFVMTTRVLFLIKDNNKWLIKPCNNWIA